MRRRQRGFTLIELGIVIAVIAILMTVVTVGGGMLTSARISNAVQLVRTIRDGARSYSMRTTGGISYQNLSVTELQNQEILPPGPATGLSPFGLNISITPLNAPTFDEFQIGVCTPDDNASFDLERSLKVGGAAIGVVTRAGALPSGGCPCGTCAVLVTTR